jgi:glutamate racemase
MNDKPIGIFDSGIGGLTVARAIADVLPGESLLYLGDTARVPYGTRGPKVITEFSLELAHFLLGQEVKALVVACNTISATCLEAIRALSPVPVLGVIEPAVDSILRTTRNKKVGILGTRATIRSGVYRQALQGRDGKMQVLSQACPLFVPLAEEGMGEGELARVAVRDYLEPFAGSGIDTMHLGCTHYPLLKRVLQEHVGNAVTIIDSAGPTAQALKRLLEEKNLTARAGIPRHSFYVTDAPERVTETARLFFGSEIKERLFPLDLARGREEEYTQSS